MKAKVTRVKLPPGIARPNKYRAKRTVCDGMVFDSKHEADIYQKVKALQAAGEILDLELQARFRLQVNGEHICDYIADFTAIDRKTGKLLVYDAKSPATRKNRAYRIKVKLLKAIHGLDVQEL